MRLHRLTSALFISACTAASVQSSAAAPSATPAVAPPARTPPATPGPRLDPAFVTANSAFATDLYAKLRDRPDNVFVSPASISVALAMTYAGARGETAAQMARALHLPEDRAQSNAGFTTLLRSWAAPSTDGKGPTLVVANRLWAQSGRPLVSQFVSVTRDQFGAPLEQVDFIRDADRARLSINAWVADKTQQRIEDLIRPGMLDSSTRLVLANAIYFKGSWAHAFDKGATAKEPFTLAPGSTATVSMMHTRTRAMYGETPSAKVLELPYTGDAAHRLSMVIVLPNRPSDLKAVEGNLDAANLGAWIDGLKSEDVNVAVPRFKATTEVDLGSTLARLGMPLAFSRQADFTGISAERGLMISKVVHKAFVDVNEEGTEAAAATGVVMTRETTSVRLSPKEFKADHPFVFVIRDTNTKSILFIGRVANPASSS